MVSDMAGSHPGLMKILKLVDEIYEGKIVLPEFQRDFVWSNRDIRDLIVSILSGYFIGTILLLRRGGSFEFKIKYFKGVDEANPKLPKEPDEKNAEKAVLDGQQRLTALFYVLHHPGYPPKGASNPYRYFIKIGEKLDNGKDWDDVIWLISENDSSRKITIGGRKYSFKELVEKKGGFQNLLEDKEFQNYLYENEIIPLPTLSDRGDLDDWADNYEDYLRTSKNKDPEHARDRKKKIKSEFDEWFEFEVPVITLQDVPLEKVAEIFERINRTGVELSVFSLATAVFFRQGQRLRDYWKKYYKRSQQIKKYCSVEDENYPKYILQIMALLQGKEVKKKVLINPKRFKVDEQKWDEAANLLDKALKKIEKEYGVMDRKYLPYKPIIVTLAALLKFCHSDEHRRKIDAWYWSSLFTGRYAGASDTAIKQDFDQVKNWINGGPKPDVVREAEARIEQLELTRITKGALCKAIFNMIATKNPRDFLSGNKISLEKIEDHHIFPIKSGLKLVNENSILNRTLIGRKTNQKIHRKKPSIYLREMKKQQNSWDKVRENLSLHLINEEAFQAMKNDDYQKFLRERERTIKEEMKKKIQI